MVRGEREGGELTAQDTHPKRDGMKFRPSSQSLHSISALLFSC